MAVPHSDEMGRISFTYLPASPLANGWRLALKEKPRLNVSVPPDRPQGLTIDADDAIDCDVEKYQRVCNQIEFCAKFSEQSYAYAKVRLVSKDGQSVSREAWIACDVGVRAPRRVSNAEWVIYRKPENDGWTKFDLSLPEEVSRTFGQGEGLQFSELLGFRLRGSLSITPIVLRHDDSSSKADGTAPEPPTRKRWTRGEKIGMWSIVIAILSLIAAFTVPEVRRILKLDRTLTQPAAQPPIPSPIATEEAEHPLYAQVAKDFRELRQQNHVAGLEDSESGKTFVEVPANSYGFADALDFTKKLSHDVNMNSRGSTYNFEVQKLSDGTGLIIGYVGPETLEHLREGIHAKSALTIYSDSWKDAPNVIAVPISRLSCSRTRILVVASEKHKNTAVSALDCEVR